ncbi:MAG: ECF-type sigma factor [Terriglobales bacterium]|jgi:RNA polymerase sigma factor (TIGR02999 family)
MANSDAYKPVSELLLRWRGGEDAALDALLPLIYDELRRVAHRCLQREQPGHTLQSTALVHEAYLRLVDQQPSQLHNQAHFFAVAARLMRQILVDHARSRRAVKRDYGCKISLEDEEVEIPHKRDLDLLALDDALNELSRMDSQQARIVELRFFSGLSIEDTSRVLGISPATVKRDWATARLWLYSTMSRDL